MNGDRKAYGYPALRISRPAIVEALLKYTNDYSGLITTRWGDSINKIAESNAGVEVTLQDGNTVNADIVIEADGIHSKVRDHVLGDRAPTPIYTGQYGLGGSVKRDEIDWKHFTLPALLYSQHEVLLLLPFTPDAGYLARLLGDQITHIYNYSAAFAHFEKVRKERFGYVREFTTQSGRTRESSNKLQRIIKKYIMWFYFHRNKGGYLRDDRFFGYDVNTEPLVADAHFEKIVS